VEVINLLFCDIAGNKPSHQIVLDWVMKCGLNLTREDLDTMPISDINKQIDNDIHIIMDNSINNSNQEIHLELAASATFPGHALTHQDIRVLDMSVGNHWDAEKIKEHISQSQNQLGPHLKYLTSDNGGILVKACSALGLPHHRDISHSFGVYLEKTYKNTEEYNRLQTGLGNARKYAHTEIGCLMPPAQRSIARFMNLFDRVDWAWAVMENLFRLPPRAKEVFSFTKELGSFTSELKEVMDWYREIETLCKTKGLSHATAKQCRDFIDSHFLLGCERQQKLGQMLLEYFNREEKLLESDDAVHNICSDIIESVFGYLKSRISPNREMGFTPLILVIPIHLRVANIDACRDFNVRHHMENTKYADLKRYREEKLLPNSMKTRSKLLSISAKKGTSEAINLTA